MTHETLTPLEVMAVLNMLPAVVIEQLRRENIVLAGGIIRDTVAGLPVKDVDIFCQSREQAERLARELTGPFLSAHESLFAFTVDGLNGLKLPIQYVFYKEYGDAADLVSQFDFRVCCAGIYWADGWRSTAVYGFHADCAGRVLHFMSQAKDAGKLTALGRALKLAQKGWKLSTQEAAAIITHFEPTFQPERVKHAFRPGYGGSR